MNASTLLQKIDKNGPTPDQGVPHYVGLGPCWTWKGALVQGRAQAWFNGKHMYAYRLSWMVFNGAPCDGLLVCHKCDNPSCVNPEHLFLGTHKDNSRDRGLKGRGVFFRGPIPKDRRPTGDRNGARTHPEKLKRGEDNSASKLKSKDIPEIRKLGNNGFSQREIGAIFSVSGPTIGRILSGRIWRES